jgi:hypothetical protein
MPAQKTTEIVGSGNFSPNRPGSLWDQAVSKAAARLDEGWILPETRCDPEVAEELAAVLCAYGIQNRV